MVSLFQKAGIRVSIFVDPDLKMIEAAASTGTDRIELYTEAYALQHPEDRKLAIQPYREAAVLAQSLGLGLGLNAGHDLSLDNLRYFAESIPGLLEVSIGHALISDALYLGLEETIKRYLNEIAN